MKTVFKRFAADESGATAIEYGLIAALVAVMLITGAKMLGTTLNAKFQAIAGNISNGT